MLKIGHLVNAVFSHFSLQTKVIYSFSITRFLKDILEYLENTDKVKK